ncbi:MAG: molybdopterin-dependent oxidoreductase [Intrasporangium sp.]|uniref:molybdopterin-dependent oxidoreductase n=1 Tax=Intrasporangium sp. TaxID=1925024 RepID=UPI003F7DB7CC
MSVLHGVLGLGLLVLVPCKSVIVRRGLRRQRGHALGIALAVVVALSLAAGIAHSILGPFEVAGVTVLDAHVAFAVAAVPLVLLHVRGRRQRPRAADLTRRTALRAIALLGAAAIGYGVLESATSVARLPGARRRATGSYEAGSGEPIAMPITQWFTDEVPSVDPSAYQLAVTRTGEPARRLTYDELLSMSDTTRAAVLDCTGGWWAVQSWRGIRMDTLLGAVDHGSIWVRSVTGYTRGFPWQDAATMMLATHAAGVPLSPGHGGPVRLVAPGRRGFWWVKWVEQVSVEPRPWWSEPPFPLQ